MACHWILFKAKTVSTFRIFVFSKKRAWLKSAGFTHKPWASWYSISLNSFVNSGFTTPTIFRTIVPHSKITASLNPGDRDLDWQRISNIFILLLFFIIKMWLASWCNALSHCLQYCRSPGLYPECSISNPVLWESSSRWCKCPSTCHPHVSPLQLPAPGFSQTRPWQL